MTLVVIQAVYIVMLLVFVPFINPILQEELALAMFMITQLLLLWDLTVNHERTYYIYLLAAMQLLVIPILLVLEWGFEEPVDDRITDDLTKAVVMELPSMGPEVPKKKVRASESTHYSDKIKAQYDFDRANRRASGKRSSAKYPSGLANASVVVELTNENGSKSKANVARSSRRGSGQAGPQQRDRSSYGRYRSASGPEDEDDASSPQRSPAFRGSRSNYDDHSRLRGFPVAKRGSSSNPSSPFSASPRSPVDPKRSGPRSSRDDALV